MSGTRSFWGWGYEAEALPARERAAVGALLAQRLPGWLPRPRPLPDASRLRLPDPRLRPPAALEQVLTADPLARAAHAYGKAFRDVVRHLRGDYPHPPDLVALPAAEADLERVLAWCDEAGIAALPYGGGSSVVGGVEPGALPAAVSIDLGRLGAVLEVDELSLGVRVQAGCLGPALEDALRPRGLTLRHFPQSFEFSSVGGWIATRSAGHHSTLRTRIDDHLEAVRMLTPAGPFESRRLPASGAGPDPNRLVLGSEGVLGVITEAWLRVQRRPDVRARGSARFASFPAGAEAARAIAQSGLQPAECRLLDPLEAELNGLGRAAVLLLGFEAHGHPQPFLDAQLKGALELCRAAGSTAAEPSAAAASGWRASFYRAPYLRDALALLGLVVETFETACTWDALPALHERVVEAVTRAAGAGFVTCRLTHVYPDGPAPYFTVLAPSPEGSELETWDAIKAAAADALAAAGGTITHHHAVGRDHRPWYGREAPPAFVDALAAAKAALDPRGVMNPGALLP